MNKVAAFIVILSISLACTAEHQSKSQKAIIKEALVNEKELFKNDTLKVDVSQSFIHWKGTKMRGTGKHEGVIQLQQAYFTANDTVLTGGKFIANMNSIEVTDIPIHEPVPRKRFNKHIKSKDFFDVETYPTSSFTITNIEQITNDSLKISGNFTLKNITKNITFNAYMVQKEFSAAFTFDRFQWNIAYKGSWIDKTFVDKDIELRLKLLLK